MEFKKTTIALCYQIVSPESCENGEYADSGFEIERKPYEIGDLKSLSLRYGSLQSRKHTGSDWYETYPDQCYETGNETTYTLHFEGITQSSLKRIDSLVTKGKI